MVNNLFILDILLVEFETYHFVKIGNFEVHLFRKYF